MPLTQVQVRRKSFGETRTVQGPLPDLGAGEILARIDKFALTANNVSYALSGDSIGYWKFFPVEEPWGVVPVWGFADVTASQHPEIVVGDRIWGFLPMASHVVLRPDAVSPRSFVDAAPHRTGLPVIYNTYQRTALDPAALTALEDERCLLFPLFSTSYVLYDYLVDNDFFGVRQILVSSASSKTGLGLTNLLSRHADRPAVIGLTSPGNLEFVRSLGSCDAVLEYADVATLDRAATAAFVDMAGNGEVVAAVHCHFGDQLKLSCAVGATHWGSARHRAETGAPPHTFFFAPAQFAKRDAEWGAGEIMRRAQAEATRMAGELQAQLTIRREVGAPAVAGAFERLVAGSLPPEIGVMATLSAES